MSNPWGKKNPFMSMWLTAANQATSSARGHVVSAAKKQAATNQAEAMRQIVDFWSGKPVPKAAVKKRRR